MGVRPSRGRETGGAPTPALIVPGSQSSSYDPWRSISFLSSKLSQRSPRPTKSSARALLVPPIEPRPRPAGHHSVRLLGTPEDPILGVVLVVRREICPGSRLDTPLLFPALRGGYIKGSGHDRLCLREIAGNHSKPTPGLEPGTPSLRGMRAAASDGLKRLPEPILPSPVPRFSRVAPGCT